MTNSGLIGFDLTILTVKVSGRERPLYTNKVIGPNLAKKSNPGHLDANPS
jgi:hypothetical protein